MLQIFSNHARSTADTTLIGRHLGLLPKFNTKETVSVMIFQFGVNGKRLTRVNTSGSLKIR